MSGALQRFIGTMTNGARAFKALCWWLTITPISKCVRRDKRLVLVYGRDGGKFTDNCKHLYASATELVPGEVVWSYVARNAELASELRRNSGHAVSFGSFQEFFLWLRAGTIVVDSVDWCQGYRFAASTDARLVQLWHGIPLKIVQMERIARRTPRPAPIELMFQAYLKVSGRFARSAVFLSTSEFITRQAFARSFRYDRVVHAGYPRNDAFLKPAGTLANLGVDERARETLREFKQKGGQGWAVLYAPTFREALNDPFADGTVDLRRLSTTIWQAGGLLLVKLHPWMHGRIKRSDVPHALLVAPDSDIYPLLADVDLLITDYSSIYFDYLLLDRPVVFFPYDLNEYLANERGMYFDYDDMTPGPKAFTMDQLVDEIGGAFGGNDGWGRHRARVRDLVFEHQDGNSAQRLIQELFPRNLSTLIEPDARTDPRV